MAAHSFLGVNSEPPTSGGPRSPAASKVSFFLASVVHATTTCSGTRPRFNTHPDCRFSDFAPAWPAPLISWTAAVRPCRFRYPQRLMVMTPVHHGGCSGCVEHLRERSVPPSDTINDSQAPIEIPVLLGCEPTIALEPHGSSSPSFGSPRMLLTTVKSCN